MFAEIAHDLVNRVPAGRLLDVGTGPGRLLAEVGRLNPRMELYGIDISESMIRLAQKRLAHCTVDLRGGTIRKTDFPDDFFDVITATGSFYLWDQPQECLEEIYRILRRKATAVIFETYRDYDKDALKKALKVNLSEENILRRMISPLFLKKQLGMTYSVDEVMDIVKKTRFARSFTIQKTALASVPIWLRIELTKT